MGPRTFRPKEIDALFASRYKSYTLTTDHLITGWPLGFVCPGSGSSETIQPRWPVWMVVCRAILIWVKVP